MDESLKITMTPSLRRSLNRLESMIIGGNKPTPEEFIDSYYGGEKPVYWPITEEYEWITNASDSEWRMWQGRGFVVSTPKATAFCSVQALREMKISGVYRHNPTSIKGVWPILMPSKPKFPVFDGDEMIEYMPIPERLPNPSPKLMKYFSFEKLNNNEPNPFGKSREKADE